ncbi:TetR/AcrR family transcriptional regulator [Paenibacillus glycanilyticus]|uniref:TetR/AcrR family transcriptional regulator n=1 Tax=Paenibacillus glycanilyticus TaxID=126569 RepID=UPI00203B3DE1|nr:TetR/AcrR family transcriptional regulator [Paenibacillus glycanilyticus]MCM3627755.1 TetR/AcrR family transcriptional regulator [Paenibacillus glycanilyticus]
MSINDIAAAAGTSIGNMYHYFKSKNEIISEILRRGQKGYGNHVALIAGSSITNHSKGSANNDSRRGYARA